MPFNDNFDGASGQKLTARTGWAQIGAGWAPQHPEINASNQLRGADGVGEAVTALDDVALIGHSTGSANHYAQAIVYPGFAYANGQNRSIIAVRAAGRGTLYGVAYSTAAGAWQLLKDGSVIQSYVATITAGGDLVRAEADGTTVRVLINGTQRLSTTLTDHLTDTNVGVVIAGAFGANPVLDTWESGPLVAAAPPTGTRTGRTFNGQDVSYTFSTTEDPTSGSFTLTGSNGGVTQSVALTLNNTTDTATAAFTALAPGTYTESGQVSGAGGNNIPITGVGSFTISAIDGSPTDGEEPPPATNPPAPSFTVSRRGRGRARSRR